MRRKLSALAIFFVILTVLLGSTAYAFTPDHYDANIPSQLTPDMLYSKAAILIDADSGNTLFSKNATDRMNPASTTKIMTLLLALESGISMDTVISIPQAAGNVPSGSSIIPVYPGDTMTFGDLLKGFQVHSGNDGGLAIAVLVAGSVDNFVARMNQRAQELGLTGTRYANPHGYTAEGHYTTAYDLAMLTRYCMQNPQFRELVKTYNGSIYIEERGTINLFSKTYILKPDSSFYYEDCVGVKTGSTSAAGECFVGAAVREGADIISVVLGATEEDYRWIDTIRLFNYGWTCYDTYTLDQMFEVASSRIASIRISNAAEDDPNGGVLKLDIAQISDMDYVRKIERNNAGALMSAVDNFAATAQIQITRDLTAPISMGEIIGDFSYYDDISNGTITAKLVASRDVAEHIEPPKLTDILPFLRIFSSKIFLLLLAVLALLILLIIVLAASRRAARQRRRREIYERRKQEYMRRQQMARSGGQYSPPQRRRSDPYDGGYTVRRSSGSSAGGRHAAPRSTAPARSSSSGSSSASRSSYDRRRPR